MLRNKRIQNRSTVKNSSTDFSLEIRCECNALLAKANKAGHLEIKCRQCKKLNRLNCFNEKGRKHCQCKKPLGKIPETGQFKIKCRICQRWVTLPLNEPDFISWLQKENL
jgi:phage FluMu protein Com